MIRLILHEKSHNMRSEIMEFTVCTAFLSAIYVIINLVIQMKKINASEWFQKIQDNLSTGNRFIKEEVQSLESAVLVYGTVAIIVMTLLFVLLVGSYIESQAERIWLLHALGCSKVRTWGYCMKAYAMHVLPAMCLAFALSRPAAWYIREHTEIGHMTKLAGLTLKNRVDILIILCIAVIVYIGVLYGKNVFRQTKRKMF